MEPKNEGLEDVFPFHMGDSQVPCYSSFPGCILSVHYIKDQLRLDHPIPCHPVPSRKRKTCHGSSSGAVGLLTSWLQRAQRQLVRPSWAVFVKS